MNAFNNFLRVDTSKEEKRNLLKDARELQAKSPAGAENASIGSYTTTLLQYAPKKVAKSQGFAGITISVVGPSKSKIELSVSTELPDGFVVLVESKSASEMRFELKLLRPSNAASLKITDCKTAITVHTVPCRLSELIELLVEQTTPPPTPPHQHTPLARVPGHRISPRLRPRMQPPISIPRRSRNRYAAALFCLTVIVAPCLVMAHLCVKSEPHLRRPAPYGSTIRERTVRYEEIIARVARGKQSLPKELLPPGSTMYDVIRFLVGLHNQVVSDVFVIASQPGIEDSRRSLAEKLRAASVITSFAADDRRDVLAPSVVVKQLRYVGEALLDDLRRLTKRLADVLVHTRVGQQLDDLYARYAHIKEFCAWFSQRWEGACKHHLSE